MIRIRSFYCLLLLLLTHVSVHAQPEGSHKNVLSAACDCIGDDLYPYTWFLENYNNTLEEVGAEAYTDDRATEMMSPEDTERYLQLKDEFYDYISDKELDDCIDANIEEADMDAFDELDTRRDYLSMASYLELHDCQALALYFKILSHEAY